MTGSKSPPATDELEVSLFGPGRGESVLVHVGKGSWMIVDSCLDRATREPVACEYLRSLGLDISQAVRLVVATHFDVDHVRGLSKVFEMATEAEVVFSSAERGPALFRAMETARRSRISDTGFSEYARLFDLLEERVRPGQSRESASPIWAVEGLPLPVLDHEGAVPGVRVISLSPSPSTSILEVRELEGFLPVPGAPQRKPVRHNANARSVVLWIEAGERRVMLGGDLEASPNPAVGWVAVVAAHARHGLVGRSAVLKVPHHGSPDAHSDEMWDRLVDREVRALVAPFAGQSKALPSAGDIGRMAARTAHLYLCADPQGRRPARREPAVERTIRETVGRMRIVRGDLGQIRVRCSLTDARGPLQVECFGPGFHVNRAA